VPQDKSPLGYSYTTENIAPAKISLVPILRSGLSMIDALVSLLPNPVPIHHLGMYREKATLQPVEYYNNLPYHSSSSNPSTAGPSDLAIIVDPVIATGATATAAVDTLRDWGVKKVIVICILGSTDGVKRVAESWEGAVEVWCGGCDESTDERGMIKPGLGDIGDRLYLTIGK
jgi:uracil phosphoribosyltransferase